MADGLDRKHQVAVGNNNTVDSLSLAEAFEKNFMELENKVIPEEMNKHPTAILHQDINDDHMEDDEKEMGFLADSLNMTNQVENNNNKRKKKNNKNNKINNNNNNNNNNKNKNNNNNNSNNKNKIKANNPLEQPKRERLQYQGIIANFIRKNDGKTPFGFITCLELQNQRQGTGVAVADENKKSDDIFFSSQDVQSNLLDLQRGDKVEFRIFVSKKANNAKPKAANVTVLKLSKRKQQAIFEYIDQVKGLLQPESDIIKPDRNNQSQFEGNHFSDLSEDEDGNNKTYEKYDPRRTMKLLSSPVVWQCLAEQISLYENGDTLLENFLEVVLMLHEKIRTLDERFRQVLLHVTSEHKFFNPVRGRFRSYVDQFREYKSHQMLLITGFDKKIKLVQDFLLLVAKMIPEKQAAILVFIKPLMENPDSETAVFLYKILKLTTRNGGFNNIEDLDWKDLPLILKREEIFNNDLTNAANLKPVKKQGKYNSAEDYVDVYFRLLREDCFYKLKKSIQDLLSGNLGKDFVSFIGLFAFCLREQLIFWV